MEAKKVHITKSCKLHPGFTPGLAEIKVWGWVFLERTRILSGIYFTTHFIEFFVVETKRFVGSFVNVILTHLLYNHYNTTHPMI